MRIVAQFKNGNPPVVVRISRPRPRVTSAPDFAAGNGYAAAPVERIFFPAGSSGRTRVLFVAADGETDVTAVCEQMAASLTHMTAARVGVVSPPMRDLQSGTKPAQASAADSWRSHCSQLSDMIWRIPADIFESNNGSQPGNNSLAREVEGNFAYFLIASRLSQARAYTRSISCDGIVLVLTANRTRREVALYARNELERCEAPLLGTILDKRTFPVPEGIYRRL